MHLLGNTNLSNLSTGDIVLGLALAVVFAFIGYRASQRFRLVVGVTPWRIPSAVWGVICFFLQPFGVILQWIAELTTRPTIGEGTPQTQGQGPGVMTPPASGIAGGPYRAPDYGAPTYPAAAQPPAGTPLAPVAPPAFAPVVRGYPPPVDPDGRNSLFGWYRDPTSRHELRYWDGRHWGDLVSDADTRSTDPLGFPS